MDEKHNEIRSAGGEPIVEPLQPAVLGNSPVSTIIYIDEVIDNEAHGMFENVFDSFCCNFHGLAQMLLELDSALDKTEFPQAYMRRRTWEEEKQRSNKPAETQRQWTEPPNCKHGLPDAMKLNRRRGIVATFCIQVITRRNASWQGTIRWLEGGTVQYFRSVLELLGLIYEASIQRG